MVTFAANLERATGLDASVQPLAAFEAVSLDELTAFDLQDRIDTKFLLSCADLKGLLSDLAHHYRVLDINGVRLHGYQTLYFDTPGFGLYHAQHAGRLNRFKVRSRRYVETRQAFLEVKHKTPMARTQKHRVATGHLLTELDVAARAFVAEFLPFDVAGLEPKLWSRFSRITLAARQGGERLTIDVGLAFGKERLTSTLPGLVVAELKQARRDHQSPFRRQMTELGIHETSFSKYCAGVALLNGGLKHNAFKPQLLRAQQISERYLQA